MSTVLSEIRRRPLALVVAVLLAGPAVPVVPGLGVELFAASADRPAAGETEAANPTAGADLGGAGGAVVGVEGESAPPDDAAAEPPEVLPEDVEYPWALRLTTANGVPFCAGALVAPTSVLTAATCVWGADPARLRVVAPADAASGDDTEPGLRVAELWTHPEHVPATADHDIALITLAEPLDRPVLRLAGTDDAALYELGGAAFLLRGDGAEQDESRRGVLSIQSADACSSAYDFYDPTWMLCAASDPGGVDPCQSEVGGPIFVLDGDSEAVIGLLPSGRGCGAAGRPGAFPNVAAYADLLAEQLPAPEVVEPPQDVAAPDVAAPDVAAPDAAESDAADDAEASPAAAPAPPGPPAAPTESPAQAESAP
ncbi:S1 family peptidase [Actinoalloteichus fjordicus]|uniref:Secreted trypsin-like serine protease n=1 Tax=Actinoalloteichus fjordicus TaxID=1612552 RepID=A0AAC9LCP6_9PSEU|nr:serine protease [Actinoalloteichus fjordicus]APU13889.1 secreted trypsin-like serine protease [Actinoalloteichus fjordicus]